MSSTLEKYLELVHQELSSNNDSKKVVITGNDSAGKRIYCILDKKNTTFFQPNRDQD
jgi:hypothetical protein